MQQLMIPQSPIVDNRGQITQEWLVFMNELIRLSNNVISSEVIDKADGTDEAIIEGLRQSSIIVPEDDEMATYVMPFVEQDAPIDNVAIPSNSDETIQNTPVQIVQDNQNQDNPYALISTIEQKIHDQQIWSLNS